MSFFDELFGGGREQGFEDLQTQLAQARGAIGQGIGFLDPFRTAGLGALGQLQGLFAQDPQDIISKIQSQFQETPGFQFQKQQAQQGLENQLAAAGLGGSGEAIQRSGQLASNLAQQGEQQNLQNVLGQRQQQIGGLEGLFQTGFGAAGQQAGLEKSIADLFGQTGEAQFGGDVARSQGLTNLLGTIGQGAGALFGAGGFGSGGGFNIADLFRAGSQPSQFQGMGGFNQAVGF